MNVLVQKLSIIAASLQFDLETQCGISGASAWKEICVNTLYVITDIVEACYSNYMYTA